jgi:ribose 5-phosphate isomerase B
MNLYLGADHAGFPLKELLKTHAQALGHTLHDLGTTNEDPVDYPDYAFKVAQAMKEDPTAFGLLVCGTGIGMSIAANRFPWIRAAVCNDSVRAAQLARGHNNANLLCLGTRLIEIDLALEIFHAFLETPFDGGRHTARVAKLATC